MDWLPSHVTQGGPWAALLAVVLGVSFLIWRGTLVPGSHVDRTVAGYKDTIASLEKERDYHQAAASRKDETIAKQSEQIDRLLSHSAVSSYALEDIIREAKRRELGKDS